MKIIHQKYPNCICHCPHETAIPTVKYSVSLKYKRLTGSVVGKDGHVIYTQESRYIHVNNTQIAMYIIMTFWFGYKVKWSITACYYMKQKQQQLYSINETWYENLTCKKILISLIVSGGQSINQSIFCFMSVHIEVILDTHKKKKTTTTYNYYLY